MTHIILNLSSLDYILVLFFVFLAGFIDSIAGGGGLISLPAYWSVGVPPHTALATNKFSSCFGTIFSTMTYLRAKIIDLPVAAISAGFALLGSWLGASVALRVSAAFLNYLLLFLVPALAVLTLINKRLGLVDNSLNIKLGFRMSIGALIGLVIGFYDGFFGPGTGTFIIILYSVLLHYDFLKANGNTKLVNLASNIAALATFWVAGQVYLPLAIPGAACGIAGNLLGSRLVVLKGNKIIKEIFVVALLLLFGRVVYNLFWN
ncbi:MAG TPA: TSUP family transporter [Candidatus Cloacimonadota bacterium]|nr:TSUP family transporter [Candidatus Cloacimonadota bacterium]